MTKIFVTVQFELQIRYFESLTMFLPKCEFVRCVGDIRRPVASAEAACCSGVAIVVMFVVHNIYVHVSSASRVFSRLGGGEWFAQINPYPTNVENRVSS